MWIIEIICFGVSRPFTASGWANSCRALTRLGFDSGRDRYVEFVLLLYMETLRGGPTRGAVHWDVHVVRRRRRRVSCRCEASPQKVVGGTHSQRDRAEGTARWTRRVDGPNAAGSLQPRCNHSLHVAMATFSSLEFGRPTPSWIMAFAMLLFCCSAQVMWY